MTINQILPSLARAHELKRSKGMGESKVGDDSGAAAARGRADRVEISQEGRILSASANESMEEAHGLSKEVLEEIRQRIDDGTYDLPAVAEEVARQILNSGDLEF